MATSQMSEVIQHLRRTVLLREEAGLTDGHLLEEFISRRGEAGLAALVRRHGPMVWGVCRRVLRNHHDAEDAFQATFLVLVRKAASVVPREMVANWLYGVANQTALKARAKTATRMARERQAADMAEPETVRPDVWHDLEPLLDQELSRLPDKYRVPIVLCDLEGKTRKEAARQLDCPEGTVAGRLARARAMLAKRLARHGFALSSGSLAVVLSQNAASACVPASLVTSTIKAASLFAAGQAAAAGVISVNVAALTEGMLKTMLLTKLKIAMAVLVAVAVLGMSTASLTFHVLGDQPADKAVQEKAKKVEPAITPVSGIVRAVDAAQSTITLANKQGEKTFSVAKDASVSIDGKPGKLADLPVEAHVTLNLAGDPATALSVQATGPQIPGVVKAIDAARNTITVAHKSGEKTFAVAKDASVRVDGKPGKLADLPVEAHVTLKLSVDQKTALSIEQGNAKKGTAGIAAVAGVVKAVDAAQNTITVVNKLGENTFTVAKDASVSIDGTPSKLADLPAEAHVTLNFFGDQKTVLSIQVDGPQVVGVVKAIDAAKNTITLANKRGEKSFTVAKNALVSIDGKPGKLADLPVEAYATLRLTVDQKTSLSIQAEGPQVSGVVKTVDAEKNTITVADKRGEHTFAVARDVKVVTDDKKAGKLADLIGGTLFSARFSAGKKEIIGVLRAEGPSFQGVVKGVDAEKNIITLSIKTKIDGVVGAEDKTFNLTKDTKIVTAINGLPLAVSDLTAEKEVILRLSTDQKATARITLLGQ